MTGPAIRYWELANVLNKYFTVTLAIPPFVQAQSFPTTLTPSFKVIQCKTRSELEDLTRQTDVIVTVGANLSIYPFLSKTKKPLVVDMYIPFMLEDLQKHELESIRNQNLFFDGNRGAHTLQIRSADFIICASEKQKDYWLGWLSALGRINPYNQQADPTFSKLITVVPFGLPQQKPRQDRPVLKGVFKNIAHDDKVILWGGGVWNWLDPYTLIKAMSTISAIRSDIKLFFMGVQSPNPYSAKMTGAAQAIELSQQLGLYEKTVFFNDWVPYNERHNYLLEADLGVNLHRNHLETRFAFRTRFLDYIWAGLPILTTEGDWFSEEVTKLQLGKVVSVGDVEAVSQGLLDLLETPNLRQHYQPNFDKIRSKYAWETVASPLIEFCAQPYLAADKSYLQEIPIVESGISSWRLLPRKVLRILRTYGIAKLLYKTKEFWRWKLQK